MENKTNEHHIRNLINEKILISANNVRFMDVNLKIFEITCVSMLVS